MLFLFSSYKTTEATTYDCYGVCADIYVGGCTLICQQNRCDLGDGFYLDYSVTTAICGPDVYVYPPDFTTDCPCGTR